VARGDEPRADDRPLPGLDGAVDMDLMASPLFNIEYDSDGVVLNYPGLRQRVET